MCVCVCVFLLTGSYAQAHPCSMSMQTVNYERLTYIPRNTLSKQKPITILHKLILFEFYDKHKQKLANSWYLAHTITQCRINYSEQPSRITKNQIQQKKMKKKKEVKKQSNLSGIIFSIRIYRT